MSDLHKATFNGYTGYYNPNTGRVKLGNRTYPSIWMAIKYLKNK